MRGKLVRQVLVQKERFDQGATRPGRVRMAESNIKDHPSSCSSPPFLPGQGCEGFFSIHSSSYLSALQCKNPLAAPWPVGETPWCSNWLPTYDALILQMRCWSPGRLNDLFKAVRHWENWALEKGECEIDIRKKSGTKEDLAQWSRASSLFMLPPQHLNWF